MSDMIPTGLLDLQIRFLAADEICNDTAAGDLYDAAARLRQGIALDLSGHPWWGEHNGEDRIKAKRRVRDEANKALAVQDSEGLTPVVRLRAELQAAT